MAGNPILLCAPTEALRAQIDQTLRAAGYGTTSVPTPAHAVAALRDARYDLVVAEGLAVSGAISGIRGASPVPTPVLIVAPAGDVEARIAFLEAGADDVHRPVVRARRARGEGRGARSIRAGRAAAEERDPERGRRRDRHLLLAEGRRRDDHPGGQLRRPAGRRRRPLQGLGGRCC